MLRIVPPLFDLSEEKKLLPVMLEEWEVLHREVSDTYEQCPCGKQGIVELCWIRNRVTNTKLFIGNCCVSVFGKEALCAKCRLYPIISPTAHFCLACSRNRKDAPTGRVTKGKPLYGKPIVGLTYQEAYLANK